MLRGLLVLVSCAIFSITCAKAMMEHNKENLKENKPPSSKKRHLSLSLKGKGRFATPFQQEEMLSMCEGSTPENMNKNTEWAIHVFNEWHTERPAVDKQCPPDLLECLSAENLTSGYYGLSWSVGMLMVRCIHLLPNGTSCSQGY